jgi:hypothetical protein
VQVRVGVARERRALRAAELGELLLRANGEEVEVREPERCLNMGGRQRGARTR